MSLTHHDLLYFDQRIERLENRLSTSEKEYASRVCDAVFDGPIPEATWVSSDSSIEFKREVKVEHFGSNGVTIFLQSYIKVVACKRFAETLTDRVLFRFDLEYLGAEDDIETEDIPPMYWGGNLKDKYQLTIKLEKV